MLKLRVLNWAECQHYRKRNPPWIKLHRSLLRHPAWVCGDDASKALAIACMLLASESEEQDGTFIGEPDYVQSATSLKTPPNYKPLIDMGLLEVASGSLAECLQDASKVLATAEERRDRGEREESRSARSHPGGRDARKQTDYSEDFELAWSLYPKRAGSNSKIKAWRCWQARLKEGNSPVTLRDGVERYAAWCQHTGKVGTETVMQAQRFFGTGGEFTNTWDLGKPNGAGPSRTEARTEQNRQAIAAALAKYEGQAHD